MKVALCFSGLPRFIERTYAYWQTCIINRYDTDVFIHTWKTGDAQQDYQNAQTLVHLYQPTLISMQSIPIFDTASYVDRIWPHRITPQAQFSQFTGIKRSQQLRIHWEQQQGWQYDIVVRARFDWYLEHVDFEINDCINIAHTPGLAGHKFYFQNLGQHMLGINDQFAYGSSHNMMLYSQLVDNIPFLYHYHKIDFCGELFLKAHLVYHNLEVKEHYWNNGIVRDTGIIP